MIAIKKIFILVLYFAAFISAAFSSSIPSTYSTDSLDDRRLGNKVLQSIWNSNLLLKDFESQSYLKDLGKFLVERSDAPKKHFEFTVLRKKNVNAFASWGGYISVYGGLILFTQNESELAAILAHEISHVTQEHLNRSKDKNSAQLLYSVGGLLASILIDDSELSEAVILSTLASDMQSQINFTREHEWEADNFAIKILHKTDFNQDALATFFERIKNTPSEREFLKTHPNNLSRVANNLSRKNISKNHSSSFDYEALKIRVSYFDGRDYRVYDERQKLYKNAFYDFQDSKLDNAKKSIAKLLMIDQSFPSLILAGRIFSKLNKIDDALNYFLKAENIKKNELTKYHIAETYLINSLPSEAIKTLKKFVKLNLTSVYTNELLAEAYSQINKMDRYHYYIGKSEFLKGNYDKSLKHFTYSRKVSDDEDFISILETEILRTEQEEQLLKIRD